MSQPILKFGLMFTEQKRVAIFNTFFLSDFQTSDHSSYNTILMLLKF